MMDAVVIIILLFTANLYENVSISTGCIIAFISVFRFCDGNLVVPFRDPSIVILTSSYVLYCCLIRRLRIVYVLSLKKSLMGFSDYFQIRVT